MPSLKEVKNRIQSVTSTQQITKAMKMVAAAKLRKAQDRIIQMRPYSQKLQVILENVTRGAGSDVNIDFDTTREVNSVLLVAITSDRGLCGGFNANVNKMVVSLVEDKYKHLQQQGKLDILAIGAKGRDFFQRKGYKLVETQFNDLFHRLTFENVRQAAEFVMEAFLSGKYDRVELVYNEFKNVATQVLKVDQLLPLPELVDDSDETEVGVVDYLFEPSKVEILAELIPKTLKITFYKALLESNAAEHGARMTSMDKATENAGELLKTLKLTYNRTRQAAITKEILEIVGGAEALANG